MTDALLIRDAIVQVAKGASSVTVRAVLSPVVSPSGLAEFDRVVAALAVQPIATT